MLYQTSSMVTSIFMGRDYSIFTIYVQYVCELDRKSYGIHNMIIDKIRLIGKLEPDSYFEIVGNMSGYYLKCGYLVRI